MHASVTPWHEPFATHERPRVAQHSWIAVQVVVPQATGATTGAPAGVVPPDVAVPVLVPVSVPVPALVPLAVPPLGSEPAAAVEPLLAAVEAAPPSMPSPGRVAPPHPKIPQHPAPRRAATNALAVMMSRSAIDPGDRITVSGRFPEKGSFETFCGQKPPKIALGSLAALGAIDGVDVRADDPDGA